MYNKLLIFTSASQISGTSRMRAICNFSAVTFLFDHAVVTEIIKMRQAFANGIPSLAIRKIIPAFAADIPGHVGSDFISGKPWFPFDDMKDLSQSAPMMLLKFQNPLVIISRLSVSRKRQFYRKIFNMFETVQIILERVIGIRPCGNVRRDIEQDLIAGKHDMFFAKPEHGISRSMSRSDDRFQLKGTDRTSDPLSRGTKRSSVSSIE